MTTKQHTFSDFSLKVAATVIAAIIIGMGTAGASFISDKVSKAEFEQHCRDEEKKRQEMQRQIDGQLQINAELLKALNGIDVKLQEVKTNTEWLMKDRDKR
ncbi:MAG: hypothetical protein RBT74_17925 [Tenuifilaceae bacterium]|jgi:hypothetical protein|nr:hypothetical protein [Tenuifilaceae bacterium]